MTIQIHISPNEKIYFIIVSLLLLCRPLRGQPSPSDSKNPADKQNFSPSMGVIIIVLIAALFFMGFFSIYIRHCTEVTPAGDGTRRRIITGPLARSRRAPRGLDPVVIESFPTFDYAAVKSAKIGKGALECAVCLTEFEDDDVLRLIPKCDHVFHPECIDQWLSGHVTCPVCRANLTEPASPTEEEEEVTVQNGQETVLDVTENRNVNNDGNSNNNIEEESMEIPLRGRMNRNRSMMRNISFGRPRWMGKFSRSFSTGHVAVKQWENNNMDRFTLRLPDDIRKQIITGKLERSTSLLVLPREGSTRRGFRAGFGEGTSRGRSRSVVEQPDNRWVFSLAPPFISRGPSVRSPKELTGIVIPSRDGSVRSAVRSPKDITEVGVNRNGSVRSSVGGDITRLPV